MSISEGNTNDVQNTTAAASPAPVKRRVMTPADLLRSSSASPEELVEVIMRPRDDRKADVEGFGVAIFDGSDGPTIKRFREINGGYKNKAGDSYEAYLYVAKRKFRGFKTGTFDISQYGGNEYADEHEWFTKHPIGLELMQFVVPLYLGEVAPELEVKNG